MDMPVTQITSDDSISIENHFRVSAGPGAGKTHWLVNHIKNILYNSKRLGRTRMIACITYTNVAVETILGRLSGISGRVEVSTIHSFLYKHIIKPYVSFIADEYELNVQEMDGHDEHIVSFSKVSEWIRADYKALSYLFNDNGLTAYHLENLRWILDGNDLKLKISKRKGTYDVKIRRSTQQLHFIGDDKQNKLLTYKKLYWNDGTLHHDDVLFFSYQLIQRFPFILKVLRAKFPYFFVDEFQDTNPIQTAILKLIGQEETIIGIIGDKAQSIYGFQGAEPEHFGSFSLPNIEDYQMSDNRRSTNQNVDLLNCIRADVIQNKFRNQDGENPRIVVGDMNAALHKCQEICGDEKVYSLSRLNITSNAMKRSLDSVQFDGKLIEELTDKDPASKSNKYRSKVIIGCVKATELAMQKRFKEAIRELEKIFREIGDKAEKRKIALKYINLLVQKRIEFESKSLYEFHSFVKENIKTDISNLQAGTARTFYDSHTYQQLALCINIKDDDSLHRTIHKSKGDEFDNVLLVLTKESDLEFLFNSDLNNEKHRLYYVAVSRAKNRLFINLPSLAVDNRTKLQDLNFVIE